MYTLVVVDMQPDFGVAEGMRVTNNCKREISKAMEDKANIIFLEFNWNGATLKELTDLPTLAGYLSNCGTVSKNQDDGSEEVARFAKSNNLCVKHFKVVGVNTDCCVLATAEGLAKRFGKAKIEVIADACDSLWCGISNNKPRSTLHHSKGIDSIKKLDGIKVVE